MRRLFVPLVGLLVLLVGCSDGDPEPKIAPTDSSSAASSTSSSPSPTASGPVEPSLPAEAEGDDAAAAEAFVRFYWEMVNYAQATGDVEGLRTLADTSCGACVSGYEGISETYQSGGSLAGGEVSLGRVDARKISGQVGVAFAVDVRADVEPQTVRMPGKKPTRYAGGPVTFQFITRTDAGEWTVMRLDVMS